MVRRFTPAFIGIFTPLLTFSANTLADEYQWDIGAHYEKTDASWREAKQGALSGTYYFNPVNTEGHVLAEAAFLERASNVSINASRTEDELFSNGQSAPTFTTDSINVRAEFYLPGDLFYAAVGATHYEFESPSIYSSLNDEESQWRGSLGITPAPGLLISSNFYEDQDLDKDWNLGAKYVNNAVAITARYHDTSGFERLSMGLDYYLDKTLSIGVKRTEHLDTDDEGNYQLNVRKFFTDRWSVSANYHEARGVDGFGVGTRLRF